MRDSSEMTQPRKIESLTVAEQNIYVITRQPQSIYVLCTGKVMGFQSDNGWCYIF
ncbi:hypothetical protein Bca4012_016629 [Brassica carinata]